ncbi:MAG TPA: M20/M25/M40 family metallo-hydrolase, partial [Kofleriaceae bacterium]|nr:M20/M25/M40 family metallo-hydrolase [Kofleriaceae bacterium]
PAGSEAGRAAVAVIERELAGIALEVEPVGDVDLPAIEVLGTTFRDARHVHVDDPDLIARFGPPGKALLIMAHYDSVPGSPGAVDDAAAVAVLLELARELQAHPPAQPVMLAFTADEEAGLAGAEALALRHGEEVQLAIALDLIGASGRIALNGASTRIGYAEMTWLARAAERAGVVVDAPLPHRVVSRWWPQAERADHGAFTRRGTRAFHLYQRGQDGLWIDTAYHSPRDTPARVHAAALGEISRLVRALVAAPVPRADGDGFWLPLAIDTVVPRWWLLAFDLALAASALLGFGALCVAGDGARTRGAGLVAGLACLAVAAVIAIAADHPIELDPERVALASFARSVFGAALVLAGVLGLVTRIVARRFAWIGTRRYLAAALAPLAAVGIALVALGAAELAWIWLVPAAALAIAPRLPRALAALATATSLLPAVLVLWPNQLLEARWNGFWIAGVPLAAWVVVLVAPGAGAVAWWLRSRPARGPLGTLVLAVGCGVSALAGFALQFTT